MDGEGALVRTERDFVLGAAVEHLAAERLAGLRHDAEQPSKRRATSTTINAETAALAEEDQSLRILRTLR